MKQKIPLNIVAGEYVTVTAYMIWKQKETRCAVNFIVDTGAMVTSLSEEDCLKLEAKFSELNRARNPIAGIGGTANAFELEDVALLFKCDNGSMAPIEMEYIHTFRNIKKEKNNWRKNEKKTATLSIPNLLGVDFFHKYKCKLSIDFEKQEGSIITQN